MKILQNSGNFNIIAIWPSKETNENAQMILEKAGRTCYQSEKNEITSETANKFIINCCKRTHFSVIEHGWRGYVINLNNKKMSDFISELWPFSKFLFITEREKCILVSANLETWRKIFISKKLDENLLEIKKDLSKFTPAIFEFDYNDFQNYYNEYDISPITCIEDLQSDEEILTHVAHTIQYNNHSRGFTHELVRHRIPVFSQESTRYVDEKDFEVILPPNKKVLIDLNDFLYYNEVMYKQLRKNKWRPEDARQILPTGISAQITMSCNLKNRRYIYFRRTSTFAHWEIRKTMCNELNYFKNLFPKLFEMFEYKNQKAKDDIIGYFNLTCNENEFCNDL
jgi:thymidylate synthase (FAD)